MQCIMIWWKRPSNCNPTSYPVAYNYFVKTLILNAVPTGYIKLYLGTKHSGPQL